MSSPSLTANATIPVRRTMTGEPVPVKHSHFHILKSTAMIGGSSVINIAFGIVRTKVMAVLLGPGGVGLMGLYSSIAEVTLSVAGMGIQSSGVRQIAEAVGSNDQDRVARTAAVLRRVSIVLGLIGALLILMLAGPISEFTFGSRQQAAGVSLLSLAVLFRLVSLGQGALIQGMRRISDLARMSVLAAAFGTIISIPMVYVFRERGIVPSLVSVAAVSILTSWWYSRKLRVPTPPITAVQVGRETAALLKLGVAFMASAFFTMGAAYVIRIIVLRKAGVEAAGLYQAAWALGGLYVGFVLQAMGADFYPRLTGSARDNGECNRLVNEQAQISLLLAGPGVIATLAVAPLVLAVFYSVEFQSAVGLLRWICLGMMLRVVAWPMGFIVLAKGKQQIFFWTEAAATIVHVGLAWLLVTRFGIAGAGAAFFGLYVWHGCLIYAVVRRLTGFRWSDTNRRLGLVFLPLTGAVFASFYLLPAALASGLGLVVACLTGIHSARTLVKLLPPASIPAAAWWWLVRLRLADGQGTSRRTG
jgi:enterobacterial common antigen flippase